MGNRGSFGPGEGYGAAGNPELIVDKILYTSYDVVKYVAESIVAIRNVNEHIDDIQLGNENVEIIRAVSEQINLVTAVAGNLAMLNVVNENSPELLALYTQLAKLLQLHANLASVVLVADNMSSINIVVQNMNKIDTIIVLLPQLNDIINKSPEILASVEDARAYALAADTSAGVAGNHRTAAETARNSAQTFAGNAQTSANGASTSASNAEVSRSGAATARDQSVTARNEAVNIRDTLLSGISAIATTVANGSPASAAYNPANKRISFEIPAGPPGTDGPANELGIGTVQGGANASASITGNHPNQKLNLTLPAGANAWQAVIATVIDGDRRVQRIVDWAGGSGSKPAVGAYLGSGGYVADIAQATNVRGSSGAGTGDMVASTYDPTNKAVDAFQMSNMSEGVDAKIFRDAERTKLAGIPADADKTPALAPVAVSGSYNDLTSKPVIPQGTVTSVGITPPVGMTASEDVTIAGKILLALSAGYNFLSDALLAKLNGIAAGATANATDAALRARSSHTGTQAMSTIDGLATAISDAVAPAEKFANKGQANGYAGLDANGKVPTIQLPEAVLGALKYQGVWNAATNSPAIPAASSANMGHYRIVNVAGTTAISGVSDWQVGDWIVSSGTAWNKVDSSDQVNSVNGKQGTVTLVKGDIGLGNVDNTSDLQKPVSNAMQTALNAKANAAHTQDISTINNLQNALDAKQNNLGYVPANSGINVTATGLAVGGGDLSVDRVINVPKATVAQAQAGALDNVALTPLTGKALVLANAPPGLGIGQTFKRPSPLPVLTTPRQNTTGKPIWINGHVIFGQNVQALTEVSSDGINWFPIRNGFFNSGGGTANYEVSVILPDGYWIRGASGNWGPYYLELS